MFKFCSLCPTPLLVLPHSAGVEMVPVWRFAGNWGRGLDEDRGLAPGASPTGPDPNQVLSTMGPW